MSSINKEYRQAKNFLYSFNNLPGQDYMHTQCDKQKYLDRMKQLLQLADNPHKKITNYYHITGTSGKGSTALFLSSILQRKKDRIGLMTSPHITKLTDRWKINQESISKRGFVDIVSRIKPYLNDLINTTKFSRVSFYDIATLIGFCYFAEKKVDAAVIEVGCGGEYDSTNVINSKEAAAITNISKDHTKILGSNTKQIAATKAKIAQKDSPLYTTEQNKKKLDKIRQVCKQQKARFKKLDPTKYKIINTDLKQISFEYQSNKYTINTPVKQQIKNAILAINIAQDQKNISNTNIKQGLQQTQLPARFEFVNTTPNIILDNAHNQDKIKTVIDTATKLVESYNDLHLIVGFCNNKPYKKMTKQLLTLSPTIFLTTRNTSNHTRKVAPPDKINQIIKNNSTSTKSKVFLDPKDSLNWIRKKSDKNDIIIATGSTFLVGELKNYLTT